MQQALHPFSEYKLYKVFHKKENRWQAMLVKPNNQGRTTLSYARYLMCVHLGRILEKSEQVDHINGDKTDDRIENFQILSSKENREKYNKIDNPAKLYKHICPVCAVEFTRNKQKSYNFLYKGKTLFCSRQCGYKRNTLTL